MIVARACIYYILFEHMVSRKLAKVSLLAMKYRIYYIRDNDCDNIFFLIIKISYLAYFRPV